MELLEREQHLCRLEEHLGQAAAGHGRMVLVGGEAGVGKTTLVDAFCLRIVGPSRVLRTSCDALSTPSPLSPVRDLAPALDLPIDQYAGEEDGRDRIFRAVFAALAAQSEPTVVIGEDAHWGDGASLDLLRFLARRIGALPVLCVVTYRDDEIGVDHPLRLVLGDLATAPAVHRMSLLPLSEKATERLADINGRDVAALHRLTGGNPFFLTEVLAPEEKTVLASVGDAVLAREEALPVCDLVFARGNGWHRGEFAWLLWQAGECDPPTAGLAEPFALQIAGDWRAAADAWEGLGCPYEAARALAEGDDPDAVRRLSPASTGSGAAGDRAGDRPPGPARGADLLRGPRPATRANPAGLTPREMEVLTLLAEGLRNAEIADRLYLTPKTVGHHLAAIFAKLGVETRTEAVHAAAQLGIGSLESKRAPGPAWDRRARI